MDQPEIGSQAKLPLDISLDTILDYKTFSMFFFFTFETKKIVKSKILTLVNLQINNWFVLRLNSTTLQLQPCHLALDWAQKHVPLVQCFTNSSLHKLPWGGFFSHPGEKKQVQTKLWNNELQHSLSDSECRVFNQTLLLRCRSGLCLNPRCVKTTKCVCLSGVFLAGAA